MFFMIGLTDGRKDFPFTQTILCSACGKYGRYQVFMTYMSLLLFFIPCARWNKHYYVQTTCCNTVYELNPEVGKRIARGEDVIISEEDLTKVSRQLDRSMGQMFYMFEVFALAMFMLMVYLLTKLIIERNTVSISMVKILGYENKEINKLYLSATTWVMAACVILGIILSQVVDS